MEQVKRLTTSTLGPQMRFPMIGSSHQTGHVTMLVTIILNKLEVFSVKLATKHPIGKLLFAFYNDNSFDVMFLTFMLLPFVL